jgi:hypothetical protein
MQRGIPNTGPLGQAKQCAINAFDTDYLMSAYVVMASVLHLAQDMDEELPNSDLATLASSAYPIHAFVADGRGFHSGRGHNNRGRRGSRGMPNKCNACGSLDHILLSCTASDDALLKWTIAKRKMIIQKYGTLGGTALAHAALLSDVYTDDTDVMPT